MLPISEKYEPPTPKPVVIPSIPIPYEDPKPESDTVDNSDKVKSVRISIPSAEKSIIVIPSKSVKEKKYIANVSRSVRVRKPNPKYG